MEKYFRLSTPVMAWCLIFFLFNLGCEEKQKTVSPEYTGLVQEMDELEYLVSQSVLLRSSQARDREAITQAIRDVRNGLLLIGQNKSDSVGYKLVKRGVEEIRSHQMLEEDRAQIEAALDDVIATVIQTARANGQDITIDWLLYSFRFSEPLDKAGFISWPAGKWETDWALDRPHVKVRGGNTRAYLIAPNFDLTQVNNPRFRIEHTLNIDRNDRRPKDPWDRQEFLRKSFKARVSTDYTGGDPNEKVCGCTWQEVDLGELPASKDFHAVQSQEISLAAFQGQNVSIMLDYNTENLGEHYITWQVSAFQILGDGLLGDGKGRVERILNHSFNKQDLAPFIAVTGADSSPKWEMGGFKPGQFDYVKIASRKFKDAPLESVNAALISPTYVLTEADGAELTISEVIRKFGAFDSRDLKILISDRYKGGPIRFEEWEEIERNQADFEDGKWTDVVTSGIPLQGLSQFTLMFFLKTSTADVTWEILNFHVRAKKGQVREVSPKVPPVLPVEGGE